jgi:hypothetical protein
MTNSKRFGTITVFFLRQYPPYLEPFIFLRFGFAVGTLGFWGTLILSYLGHTLTIPTAFALSELATNNGWKEVVNIL